ncbi:hypothetical protein N7509_009982 [Penicillium cosmopolitanum]|uniref:F-box domain-containing protein n=1 Tax=Penicillium cosmopolitanum TaxID=1131564 RepID=A0A9X0B473_9EURO|nr:uncharacterized protein N7509_009982 [Penicillium cosmopolitanum]KAJ5387441.1 hypothetical protein N7509_009982 [Penicillium cosmopolitanum]
MNLLNLPNELVIDIADLIEDEYSINALHQTCKRFHQLLNHSLYELNVRISHACALEWAAKNGYHESARKSLQAGASPNASVFEEWLPMALACIHGHDAIVQLLIDYGVDPSSTESWLREPAYEPQSDDEGCPLILAAGRDRESVVRLLISHGVDPDIRSIILDDIVLSGLGMAARNGHLSIVKLLVELGCDPYIKGWFGSSILADAAHGGHYETVRFLLGVRPPIEPSVEANSALDTAAQEGHADVVDLLLENGKTPTPLSSEYPLHPLIMAVQRKHYLIVEKLRHAMDLEAFVRHGEPDDDHHRQLLMISAACGWNSLLEKLLQRGCSTDFLHTQRLLWSLKEKRPGLNLFKYERHASPLALAAHRGHHDSVKLLLNHETKASVIEHLLNEREGTPLLAAIDGGHKRIINMLLDKGADPNLLTHDLIPIFFKAIDSDTPEILELLFDRGANPELEAKHRGSSDYGKSVYVQALASGNLSTVKFLQRRFSFKEPQRPTGSFSLSYIQAAAQGGFSMMEYLLQNDYSVMPGSPKVAEALRVVLSKADTASLALLFERQLIEGLVSIGDKSIMALVDSPSRDLAAMAATLDMLLAHGIKMQIEERDKSPLHDLNFHQDRLDLFKLLLDRGADPLRKDGKYGTTPLTRASETGSKELVRLMLETLDGHSIPLEKLKRELGRAEYMAELALERFIEVDVRPLLRRFYWRKKYQHISMPNRRQK